MSLQELVNLTNLTKEHKDLSLSCVFSLITQHREFDDINLNVAKPVRVEGDNAL